MRRGSELAATVVHEKIEPAVSLDALLDHVLDLNHKAQKQIIRNTYITNRIEHKVNLQCEVKNVTELILGISTSFE